jgi:hypothetical protein
VFWYTHCNCNDHKGAYTIPFPSQERLCYTITKETQAVCVSIRDSVSSAF